MKLSMHAKQNWHHLPRGINYKIVGTEHNFHKVRIKRCTGHQLRCGSFWCDNQLRCDNNGCFFRLLIIAYNSNQTTQLMFLVQQIIGQPYKVLLNWIGMEINMNIFYFQYLIILSLKKCGLPLMWFQSHKSSLPCK